MTEPQNMEEYRERFAKNEAIEGEGLETRTRMPCPFCGAPDFMVHRVIDSEIHFAKGATCKECGRSAKMVIESTEKGTIFELVQTGGDDPPEWLIPKMRRVE